MFRTTLLSLLALTHNALSQSNSIPDGPGGLTLNPDGEYNMSQIGNLASSNNQTYVSSHKPISKAHHLIELSR